MIVQKTTTDAIKTALKRANQKTAEATSDLIGNKIPDKITSVSKCPQQSFTLRITALIMKQKHQKKIHISKKETKNNWWFKVNITV